MAAKLFKLRGVPDDEAEEVRQLLMQHELSFYETDSGGWGISVPAIWLHDKSNLKQAKALISDYQQQRAVRVRAEYQQDKDAGLQSTVMDRILHQPLRFVLLIVAVSFVLYVSLAPFVYFAE